MFKNLNPTYKQNYMNNYNFEDKNRIVQEKVSIPFESAISHVVAEISDFRSEWIVIPSSFFNDVSQPDPIHILSFCFSYMKIIW